MQNHITVQAITNDRSLFHIHTFRCGHAEKVSDEAYVTRALELGATDLWFSDHAPFPNDPFRSRMRYSQLQEYITMLDILKKKYANRINIHIGLEIEYFPSFDATGYYRELRTNQRIEFLLLGQHMAELSRHVTPFPWSANGAMKTNTRCLAMRSSPAFNPAISTS